MSLFVSSLYLSQFLSENYITFLLLGGLLIVMYVYRDVRLPSTRNFIIIILVLLAMCISNSLERWATFSPDRLNVRIITSVIHYILQPFVIWLELIIIMPEAEKKRRLKLFLLSIPIILNTVIYLVAPFTGRLVFYYDENYWFTRGILGHSIYIVTFFYLALLLIWSIRFLREKNRRKSILLFFMIAVAVLTAVLEALNLAPGFIDEAFALGLFLYYMYLVTVHEQEMQAQLAKQELELSQNKVKLLREQMQPHFIFNSLHIIKALIRSDPERAIQGVEDFSDYLRANLDAITSDKLIHFNEELTHIRAYAALALTDESKGISIRYEIEETGFFLPPLTVQPMVENAIRHGLRNGGTVTLSTGSDNGFWVITVADDGKGFDTSATKQEKDRTGIGLANTKERLATLCGGTMQIDSSKNGTVVTIRLPKGT